MKEKLRYLIAQKRFDQGRLKLTLRNFEVTGQLTDEIRDALLDEINQIEADIEQLYVILKEL